MPEGMSLIERRIEQFETALEDMRQATSECHSMLKQLRDERRTIENLLKSDEVKRLVETRVNEVVTTTLNEIGPEIRKSTNLIYEKVGKEMDRLIDLSMGSEFSKDHDRLSIRPILAAKLKEWLREEMAKDGFQALLDDVPPFPNPSRAGPPH